jgi:hypothetical protein
MKTKPLTFLLALTFLFLFSGSVYGGVFDKEDEITSLYCPSQKNTPRGKGNTYLVINMKEKIIKEYSFTRKLIDTIQIKKVTELWIFGENKTKTSNWTIDRHLYFRLPQGQGLLIGDKDVVFLTHHLTRKDNGEVTNNNFQCTVGDRIF